MPDAYEIAQDLFNQGWRVKISDRNTSLVSSAILYDQPIYTLYHFTTPGGEEFESYGFFEMAKRLGGKFYNEYSSGFCEKILASLIALYKTELNKKPENPKIVVVGQISNSNTWVLAHSFGLAINWPTIEEINPYANFDDGLNKWFKDAGNKKVKMTIEVLGECER